MDEFFIPFGNIFSFFRSKVKGLYQFGYEIINGATEFNTIARDQEKLAAVLANPAALKVFALQCDLFSMGRVSVRDQNNEEIADDPFLKFIKRPNPFTLTESQFLWDFMFWNMMGTAYLYCDSKIIDKVGNKLYYLNPARIEWPQSFERLKDKMIFSDAELRAIAKTTITYRYNDGSTYEFPFDRLIISYDLTNSIGNFFKGPSRLDALYKIISNTEHVIDAENVTIRYTKKFMVGGDQDPSKAKPGLSESEKTDITEKIDDISRTIYPVKSKVNISRFVDDIQKLQLGGVYLDQYFRIGNMYNIPRDVLEAYNSATYENQEKARAAHVNYTLDPKGNQWMDAVEIFFGYDKLGKNIVISWDHLPFMQIFAKEKAETQKVTIEVLNSLLGMGVPLDEANKYIGTEFTITPPASVADQGSSPETLAAQAALRGSVGGVQGILAVQQGVSAGTTTYDAGLSILMIIYGFTREQAINLLGQPEENGQQETQPGGDQETQEGSGEEGEDSGDS